MLRLHRVISAGCLSLALVPLAGIQTDQSLGLFAGSGTSSATLQAIIAALKTDGAAIGYSVAYPFGVALPILCIHLLNTWLKPKIEPLWRNRSVLRNRVTQLCLFWSAFPGACL